MFVTDAHSIKPGFRWAHQRITHSAQMRALYHGDFSGFITKEHAPPGLTVDDILVSNWFKAITSFYRYTVSGEALSVSEPIANMPDLIEDLVTWRSITGYAVAIRRMNGECHAIDPTHWCPIFNPADHTDVWGAVLGFPYYHGQMRPDESALPNRIDIVIILNSAGTSTRMTYELSGQTLGAPIGGVAQADAVAVAHWGDGISDYPAIEDAVRQYAIRMAGITRILNRHSNPLLTGPQSVLVPRPGASPNDPNAYQLPDISGGVFLARQQEQDVPFEYITWDGRLEAANQQIDRLLAYIQDTTGVPMSMNDNGSPLFAESGSARQVGLYAATSRIRRERRGIEQILKALYNGIRIHWLLEPFEDRAAREESVREMFAAGLISREEGRMATGYGNEATP